MSWAALIGANVQRGPTVEDLPTVCCIQRHVRLVLRVRELNDHPEAVVHID
jgi:hypothetical protein